MALAGLVISLTGGVISQRKEIEARILEVSFSFCCSFFFFLFLNSFVFFHSEWGSLLSRTHSKLYTSCGV